MAGIIPKAVLTTSRIVYQPFLLPAKLDAAATNVGTAGNDMVKGINAAVGNAYNSLEPKGPAKWLTGLFAKVDAATTHSAEIQKRNKDVFWDPFAVASESMGRAIVGPGVYYYAKKANIPDPSNPDTIKGLLNMKLFDYPEAPPAAAGGGEPAAPPPAEAGQQAAEGAAQAQPQEQPAAA